MRFCAMKLNDATGKATEFNLDIYVPAQLVRFKYNSRLL